MGVPDPVSSSNPAEGEKDGDLLPAYATTAPPPPDADVNVTAAFEKLNIPRGSHTDVPGADACLAHLKLLHAIQEMKEDVGYTNGLWNIWDSRAENDGENLLGDNDADASKLGPEEKKKLALSKIREKRWALFVARAVDRYESWWATLRKDMLNETDMTAAPNDKYDKFPTTAAAVNWEERSLPPLDVLMVMHSHMLNPRSFLEDSMRHGLKVYWASGMSWQLISDAIDTQFNYKVSDSAKTNWVAQTGHNWANVEDSPTKQMKCPFCDKGNDIPWTTCGVDEKAASDAGSLPGLVGNGYGDGSFNYSCPKCRKVTVKETLSVAKFVDDSKLLLGRGIPMPGTILDPVDGRPEPLPNTERSLYVPRTFPNRMIQLDLRLKILDDLDIRKFRQRSDHNRTATPTMTTVRDMIEKTIKDNATIRKIDGIPRRSGQYVMKPKAKVCVRKMMSRYWENFSPFALDLGGAVMRQGVFIDKMVKLDWLHSPSARETMTRLRKKYTRFVDIMARNPGRFVVPTLDVDLAWHTHQLDPQNYYVYTVTKTRKFVDHDDKVEEGQLSEAFEWTTKEYQDTYKELYSECTCWYCESIRTANISSIGKFLGVSTNERLAENFHTSGAAKLCPPDNSAHISAHNAVKSVETLERERFARHVRARQQEKLARNYEKATKRAAKRGRTLPARDQYYDHWGYSYYMYSPYMYPMYFTPGLYYGWDPGYVYAGAGGWASCAAGSCGSGGVAAGACGGPGGCGGGDSGGCAAAAGCASGGGCSSGGGGDGGGGGGGGCGGGGGGGGCGGGS